MKKKVIGILIILIITILVVPANTFVSNSAGIDTNIQIGQTNAITSSVGITNKIFGALQVAGSSISVIALIIIGLRYMFSSVQERADMKGVLIYWIIGCILVFATSNVLSFVYDTIEGVQHEYYDVPEEEGGIEEFATCVGNGIRLRKCRICGKTLRISIPADSEGGHGWNDWVVINPTCTEDGYKVRTCRYCGRMETDYLDELKKLRTYMGRR